MGLPVRIDSDLYGQAKSHAHAERRTISGQIEFWAMIGKAACPLAASLKANSRVIFPQG